MSTLEQVINEPRGGFYVAPQVTCADGFTVSVQGSDGHYCTDAEGKRPMYAETIVGPMRSLEVGYPSARPEPWACPAGSEGDHWDRPEHDETGWECYAETPASPTGTVYGKVPVEMVRALIESHGGER